MIHRPIHSIAGLALSALAATSVLAQAPALTPEQGWSAVGQCASVVGDRARHACLDDLLRRAGLLTPQAEAIEKRRQFGLDATRTAPAPVAAPALAPPPKVAPAPAAVAPPPAPPPPAPAVPERLEARIASLVTAPDHKLVLTTADGAVWKQSDSDTIPQLPRAGESVRIRKATLGSYLCELPSHHTFRCVRLK